MSDPKKPKSSSNLAIPSRKAVFYITYLTFILLLILGIEFAYRLYLKVSDKPQVFIMTSEDVLSKSWFQPHPHLIYTFKPMADFYIDAYGGARIRANKFGFRSTAEFDPETKRKPPGCLRIIAFGGSTTMSINADNQTWPYQLGHLVTARFRNMKVEVLNEGVMGYTSLDNLIDLATRVIDFPADVYVFYLGVNDFLAAAPPGVFKSDNSHFRRTLYESLVASPVDMLPKWIFKSRLLTAVIHLMGVPDRRDLVSNTSTGQFRKKYDLGSQARESNDLVIQNIIRNIKSMAGIIREHNKNATMVMVTFYHFENPEYIKRMNGELRILAQAEDMVTVDLASQMPRELEMAYDYGHFTPEGERIAGGIIARPLIKGLLDKNLGHQ